ncbi:unnamed protein product [Adineta steineri]|uniref:Uncharacterized protein n=1 Tax=Adineta steineri TaxID=433720 RepID=A0A814PDL5_9BILA|nr:unnamed protein product [Adineta steineri]CAF1104245.1 unnamed protein product [Adineta steineri]
MNSFILRALTSLIVFVLSTTLNSEYALQWHSLSVLHGVKSEHLNTRTHVRKTRRFHAGTSFNSHKITGSYKSSNDVAISEIYDPLLGVWNIIGSMAEEREAHAATILKSGKVLVVGGENLSGYLTHCEIYNPSTSQWSSAGSMVVPRAYHTVTLLNSGKVLVTVGRTFNSIILASCEIYDPDMDTWSLTGNMTAERTRHTAILLNSGKVLVTRDDSRSEVYDPITGKWNSLASMGPIPRYDSVGTLLSSGKVLLSGQVLVSGGVGDADYFSSCEIYNPLTGKWNSTSDMTESRSSHTTTLLSSGKILATAGYGGAGFLDLSEIYDPSARTRTRSYHSATVLNSGKILIAGGEN